MPASTDQPLASSPHPEPVGPTMAATGTAADTDAALTQVADLFLDAEFNLTVPAWDRASFLQIANARGALCSLTIHDDGAITWDYRSVHGCHVDPAQLAAITLDLLDPDDTRPGPAPAPNRAASSIHAAAARALTSRGMTATSGTLVDDPTSFTIFGQAIIANPARPDRGTVAITDDGQLLWNVGTLGHPAGGLPLPAIGTAITRALIAAQHTPDHA